MEESEYQIELTSVADQEQLNQLWAGLRGFNLLYAPPPNHTPLLIILRDGEGQIVGGIVAGTSWNWLHVDALWLRDNLRGQGYGSRLMQVAEAEAIRRGCNHSMVDTFDFQAPKFYEKLGYVVWGVLEDYPGGGRRIFYRKDLQVG